MFAFALWNERDKSLFLARDRLGIKPLFYSFSPGRQLVFASEIKSVLRADVERTPDYQAIYDYLSLMYVPTPATAFASIRKLPPGSSLTCSRDGMQIQQYWDIPLPDAGTEDKSQGNSEEEILSLLQQAVSRHMIADVPVGAFLSGGLDSTTVVAIMAKRLGLPVKTYTMGFKEKSYDESEEARLVAKTLGTDHREKTVEPSMIESIPDLLGSFDEPFADYSAIPTYLVSKLASKELKVVLTGDGGDEIFAGYPTHYAYRVTKFFRLIPKWVRDNFISPLVMCLPTSMDRISFDYMAKRFVTGADLPFQRGHYWWKVIFSETEKDLLCAPEFLSMGFRDTFEVFDTYFQKARRAHPLNQLLYVDAKTFLLDDNLVKVDRMTMANSLEARVPLLDHELVERMAMIDPTLKSRGFETKRVLRRAARTLLPPQIQKGKKKGFTPPLPYWIGNDLRSLFEEYFDERKLGETGILNPGYCRRILDEHVRGVRDNNRQLWTILSLLCWLEKQSEPSRRSA
jgi:asparagine synthase (glutamine-hydrolysing)